MINLYSDTQTLPTESMLKAMTLAELGDDMQGLDPTVNRLEAQVAQLTGKEAALLVTSGTQGNLAALMGHGGHGDEVFMDPNAHVYFYEAGALCSMAGYTPRLVADPAAGRLTAEALKAALHPEDVHFPRPRVLCLENTHNRLGGRVMPQAEREALLAVAREAGLKVHLDGARIWNAAVALDLPVAALCDGVDSVQVCLSKGLSCPIGSVLCGSADFIARARRIRKRLGGAMRQAGIIAACGLEAVKPSWIARLGEDHRRAQALASGLAEVTGIEVDLDRVDTNMVFVDVSAWRTDIQAVTGAMAAKGVKVSSTGPGMLRLVTHRHITDPDVTKTIDAFHQVSAELISP